MPDTNIPLSWYVMVAITVAVIAAVSTVGVGFITWRIKIAEFRQAWINVLRDDIVEFAAKVDDWLERFRLRDDGTDRVDGLEQLRLDIMKLRRRIELRFNPRSNPDEAVD